MKRNKNGVGRCRPPHVKRFGVAGLGAGAIIAPVYALSRVLFETAVLRDNSRRKKGLRPHAWQFARKVAWQLAPKMKEMFEKRRKPQEYGEEKGLGFEAFPDVVETGKQWFWAQEKERITMRSHDGLRLLAYYLPAKEESDRVLILMHGYRNDGYGDFSGLFRFYHEQGYHLLAPHQRSHGESEGEYICFGVKERYDLKQWTEYIAKRFQGKCKIFLSGISMGGATVLMATGLELPKQVKGIIADCAFTSPWDIFASVLQSGFYLPRFPILNVADRICRRRAGFGFKECSTLDCMRTNRIPVLFIHGGADTFVPTQMSSQNYEACVAEKELLIVKRAAHATSNMVDPESYRSKVIAFMDKYAEKENADSLENEEDTEEDEKAGTDRVEAGADAQRNGDESSDNEEN